MLRPFATPPIAATSPRRRRAGNGFRIRHGLENPCRVHENVFAAANPQPVAPAIPSTTTRCGRHANDRLPTPCPHRVHTVSTPCQHPLNTRPTLPPHRANTAPTRGPSRVRFSPRRSPLVAGKELWGGVVKRELGDDLPGTPASCPRQSAQRNKTRLPRSKPRHDAQPPPHQAGS